ncbi:unnamed protein product, partial [Brassica rapa subsp. trilocularis]
MHASTYQRDIATAQQVAKTSGAPAIGCLTVLPAAITSRPMVWHYGSDCGFNYSYSSVSCNLCWETEFYALFIEEGLDLSNTLSEFDLDLSLMENEQEGYGLTRSLGSSSRRDIFLMAQDQEICFGDVS